ncbi:MAG: histidine phosphatase family protein [archaeon]|nr:histidine phosphatase family protein [archaeon]
MKVFVCRHGETLLNLQGRSQGAKDSALTEKGISQAEENAKVLETVSPAAIYCSPLGRAFATAKIIAKPHNMESIPVDALSEINQGKFEGTTAEERKKLFAKEIAEIEKDKMNNPFPGGESFTLLKERLVPFVEMLKEKHSNDEVIVVTHRACGRMLTVLLAGLSDNEFLKSDFLHYMIYKVELNGSPVLTYLMNGKTLEGLFLP